MACAGVQLLSTDATALHYRHLATQMARALQSKTMDEVLLDRARGHVVSSLDPVGGGVHCSLGGGAHDFIVTSTLASQGLLLFKHTHTHTHTRARALYVPRLVFSQLRDLALRPTNFRSRLHSTLSTLFFPSERAQSKCRSYVLHNTTQHCTPQARLQSAVRLEQDWHGI